MSNRDLLQKRVNMRPVEYPEFTPFKDAIRHAYWVHTEFNLSDDIHDFHARVSEAERSAITRTMLAIAQVEVSVKSFWGDLMKRFPKPEVGAVGYTFAESEVRHQDAYAHLLHVLGLNSEFEKVQSIPALKGRVEVLNRAIENANVHNMEDEGREFATTLLLFSAFTEHVSLFSQFLIMKSFQRSKGLFKGVANIVDATSMEEQIHGLFGYELINILKQERPHWFDDAFDANIREVIRAGYEAEKEILDWIFEEGELDFLPKATVEAFLQHRFNNSLTSVGMEPEFTVDQARVDDTLWFEEEILAAKHVDFFHKRPTTYAKKSKSISADDLFAA